MWISQRSVQPCAVPFQELPACSNHCFSCPANIEPSQPGRPRSACSGLHRKLGRTLNCVFIQICSYYCVSVCICVCMSWVWEQSPAEARRGCESLGAGVTMVMSFWHRCWEPNSGPLQEQCVFLTTELPPQPFCHSCRLVMNYLNFLSYENVIVPPSFLMNIVSYRSLGWQGGFFVISL